MAKPRPCQNMYPDSPFPPQKPDVTPQSGSSRPSRQSGLFKSCWFGVGHYLFSLNRARLLPSFLFSLSTCKKAGTSNQGPIFLLFFLPSKIPARSSRSFLSQKEKRTKKILPPSDEIVLDIAAQSVVRLLSVVCLDAADDPRARSGGLFKKWPSRCSEFAVLGKNALRLTGTRDWGVDVWSVRLSGAVKSVGRQRTQGTACPVPVGNRLEDSSAAAATQIHCNL